MRRRRRRAGVCPPSSSPAGGAPQACVERQLEAAETDGRVGRHALRFQRAPRAARARHRPDFADHRSSPRRRAASRACDSPVLPARRRRGAFGEHAAVACQQRRPPRQRRLRGSAARRRAGRGTPSERDHAIARSPSRLFGDLQHELSDSVPNSACRTRTGTATSPPRRRARSAGRPPCAWPSPSVSACCVGARELAGRGRRVGAGVDRPRTSLA